MLNKIDYDLLASIADLHGTPSGAFNLRQNGQGVELQCTENVTIKRKTDKPGIDIIVKPGTKNETVYIPVIVTESGINDMVYNDFEIGENADVVIIAGCGIHNDGCSDSQHDGIHTFHLCKGSHVKYIEKHYGEGTGTGARILNPTTVVNMDEDSRCEMEMTQIKGVNSTVRTTTVHMGSNARLMVVEKLMTHGSQAAKSDIDVYLDGKGSSAQIISRSVAKNHSVQVFHPNAIGNEDCRAHIQCDSIIMDEARVKSIPAIAANHQDAQIIHEAAIGRINNDQLLKLQTFGLSKEEAEAVIIDGFLK